MTTINQSRRNFCLKFSVVSTSLAFLSMPIYAQKIEKIFQEQQNIIQSLHKTFNGERPDPVNHCYHLGQGHRTYNPILMRFHSPDIESPFGEGGLNPYSYCLNDPINQIDQNGNMSTSAKIGIAFGVISLIIGILVLTM